VKREFNYTGRRKIHLNQIKLRFVEQRDGSYSINISFDLTQLNLQSSLKVYMEVSYMGFFQVIDFGTLDQPKNTYSDVLKHELAPYIDSLKCILKIVDEESDIGLIKAMSPRIRGSVVKIDGGQGGKKSFLEVVPRALGEVPWRLEYDECSVTLLINDKIENKKYLLQTDPIWRSLIFPSVVREIVTKIVSISDYTIDGDEWYIEWNKYIRRHLKIEFPDEANASDEIKNEFINETVDKFCMLIKSTSRLNGK